MLLASAVAFTSCLAPAATSTVSAKSCPDVDFIFARGSGQPINGPAYTAFKDEITTELSKSVSGLSYHFYDLGSNTYGGARYPAVELTPAVIAGATVSLGKSFAFGKSIDQGITELKNYIAASSATCKNTKFILGGYSQGAIVLTNALSTIDSNKIIFSATFGDPKLSLPEGKGIFPDACRGYGLSEYRYFAPNCRTHSGILGAKEPYSPAGYFGKVGLWCSDQDFMCGAGLTVKGDANSALDNAMHAHTSYIPDGHYRSAAEVIVSKIIETYPSKKLGIKPTPKSPPRDTVILLDVTGSMQSLVNTYRKNILNLAKNLYALDNNRIAFYTYGDLEDAQASKVLDFGATYSQFAAAFDSVSYDGGGDEDESVLSALKTVMNQQKWRAGAMKSIVLITDAGYHDPDLDLTTLKEVVNRSLAIDPVNVYAATTDDILPLYTNLTLQTSGQSFLLSDALDFASVYQRPSVNFPLSNYAGAVGQEFQFDAIVEGDNITSYVWDLDFDGVFETPTNTPTIKHRFTEARSGFLQLKITDTKGYSSTASAFVTIGHTEPTATVEIDTVTSARGTATITYHTKNAKFLSISINDDFVGLTENLDSLDFTGITQDATISLTPISYSGQPGTPATVSLKGFKLLAPNSGQQ